MVRTADPTKIVSQPRSIVKALIREDEIQTGVERVAEAIRSHYVGRSLTILGIITAVAIPGLFISAVAPWLDWLLPVRHK